MSMGTAAAIEVTGTMARVGSSIGLGIAIAKALVHLHGGQLRIGSSVGRGTLVSLRLPLKRETGRIDRPQEPTLASNMRPRQRTAKHESRAAA